MHIYSTNPSERLNKEIKRRTNVAGIFPDGASVNGCVSISGGKGEINRSVGPCARRGWLHAHKGLGYDSPQNLKRAPMNRLLGAILMAPSDEWQVGRHCFSKESMRKLYEPEEVLVAAPAPLRLALVR